MSRYLIGGEGGLTDVGSDVMMVEPFPNNLGDNKVSFFEKGLFL